MFLERLFLRSQASGLSTRRARALDVCILHDLAISSYAIKPNQPNPIHHDLLTSTFPSIKGHTGTLRVVSAVRLLADRGGGYLAALLFGILPTNKEGEEIIDFSAFGPSWPFFSWFSCPPVVMA